MVLSIFFACDFEGFHCFNPWPPPAAVAVTGAFAAVMLEPFASGEAFSQVQNMLAGLPGSWRSMALVSPWGH